MRLRFGAEAVCGLILGAAIHTLAQSAPAEPVITPPLSAVSTPGNAPAASPSSATAPVNPPGAPAPVVPAAPGTPAAPTATAPPNAAAPAASNPGPPAGSDGGIAELEGFLEPFLYDVNNRRDPFQPWSEYVPSDDSAPARALSPAQRWELEKLKLIGIMWDIRDPKSMFLDPDGDVMILGRDESIGNKNGYIAAIREGEVVVVESVRRRGDLAYRTKVLRIER